MRKAMIVLAMVMTATVAMAAPNKQLTRQLTDGPDPVGMWSRTPTDGQCVETAEACGIQGTLSCTPHGGFISLSWNSDVRFGACVATCQDGTTMSTNQCVDDALACLGPGEQGPCPTDMSAGTETPDPIGVAGGRDRVRHE